MTENLLPDGATPHSPPPARAGTRNREKTKDKLQCAILRIKNKGLRLSIKAVAEEAGVDPSLIHNTYPDIAEVIRASLGRASRQQRDDKHQELVEVKNRNRELRESVAKLTHDLNELASVNLTLLGRIHDLEEKLTGKVVHISGRSASGSAATTRKSTQI